MYPVIIPLNSAVVGDRWHEIAAIGPVRFSDAPPSFPLIRVRMQFRDSKGVVGCTLDSSDVPGRYAEIIISNPDTWFVHMPELAPLPLGVGRWDWDIEFYSSDAPAAPVTLYRGLLYVAKGTTSHTP